MLSLAADTRLFLIGVIFCFAIFLPALSRAGESKPSPAIGTTGVIVQSKFGGQIFGFDIDAIGTEGVLSEAQTLQGGAVLAAVETFDQGTGRILNVLAKSMDKKGSDFITLGVVGDSVGLVEREHVKGFLKVIRAFDVINPIDTNQFNGTWTPPVGRDHLVQLVSRNQGTPSVAVWAEDISGNFQPFVFSSNVAANTFGPVVAITDQDFTSGANPGLAYDPVNNRAILGKATLGIPFIPGKIATVDLATGRFTKFTGVGLGDVNGMAYNPVTGTACTTTEIDFSVEFYNIATQTGFA